jgi:hypothetical protein
VEQLPLDAVPPAGPRRAIVEDTGRIGADSVEMIAKLAPLRRAERLDPLAGQLDDDQSIAIIGLVMPLQPRPRRRSAARSRSAPVD